MTPRPALLRLSTGIEALDTRLGGGLIPGTLTVIVGASGIGKTQLGLQFVNAGGAQEGTRGIVFDMSARIDSQSHAQYAQRMFGWSMVEQPIVRVELEDFYGRNGGADYLHVFEQRGRRVTERDMDFNAWHDWQAELAAKLELSIAFLYGNFVRGARRVVIDGIEPVDRPSESIQFELFNYIYHQILRKDSEWVARDLFRQSYRAQSERARQHAYDYRDVGAMLMSTSHETMLEPLIERPLVDGDMLATANTLIYMGKMRDGNKLARGMLIAKHRGSACSDEILCFTINEGGLKLE